MSGDANYDAESAAEFHAAKELDALRARVKELEAAADHLVRVLESNCRHGAPLPSDIAMSEANRIRVMLAGVTTTDGPAHRTTELAELQAYRDADDQSIAAAEVERRGSVADPSKWLEAIDKARRLRAGAGSGEQPRPASPDRAEVERLLNVVLDISPIYRPNDYHSARRALLDYVCGPAPDREAT